MTITYKIEGHPDLVKVGGAIINNNEEEYQKARTRVRLGDEIAHLKERMEGIEIMLNKILEHVKERNDGDQ